jgi:polar amino acid transport system substrate-binding protein
MPIKIIHLRFLPFLTMAAWVASGHAATLAEIKQRGYAVVAVADADSRFSVTTHGRRTGFDAELLNKLRLSAPFEIRLKIVSRDSLTAALENGDADIIATSLEITPDLQKTVDFTPPVAESTFYYLVRRGDPRIKSVDDLGARRLGIRTDSESVLALTELEHMLAKEGNKPLGATIEYSSGAQAYRALAGGHIDYVIDHITDLAEAAKSQPAALAIGQPVSHKTYVAWAVARNNADLGALLKSFMLQERNDGDLASLQHKWLGWNFPNLPDSVTAQDWWTTRTDRPSEYPIPTPRDPD